MRLRSLARPPLPGPSAQLGLAEIDIAGQLAHHQQIHTLQALRAHRRGIQQLGVELHRAQVGKHTQRFTQCRDPAQGGPKQRDHPTGTAHGPQQDRIGLEGSLQGFIGQGCARKHRWRSRRPGIGRVWKL